MSESMREGHAERFESDAGRSTGPSDEVSLLRAILDGVHDAAFAKDRAGRYVYLNNACARVFHLQPERAIGRTDTDILSPSEAAALRAVDRAVMSSAETRTVEEKVTSGGRVRSFLTTKSPWCNDSGEIIGIIGIARDITEQRDAEVALLESEERFRLLADTAPVLMWTTRPDASSDFFNQTWLDFTGVPLEAQLDDGWMQVIHPDDLERCVQTYMDAFAARRTFRMEYRLRRYDGSYHWVLDSGSPRFAPGGQFLGYVGACTDIHESVLQQQALEEGAWRLQQLTAELEATVAELRRRTEEAESARARSERTEEQARFLDEASRVLHSSLDHHETLRSVVRLAVPRIADRCVVHLVSEGDFDLIDSAEIDGSGDTMPPERYSTWARIGPVRVARTGEAELHAEISEDVIRQAAVDDEHLALLRASALHSAMVVPMQVGGRVIGTISFLSVESKRRFGNADLRLAEELARRAAIAVDNARLYRQTDAASRTKSEFLATMSHELRTPLNAISGYTDLLQLGISEPEQQQEHLSRIKASTWHLLAMIEEILTFSRLEAGRAEVYAEIVDARGLVHDAASLLHPVVASKGLTLDLRLPDVALNVETDRIKIGHILMNLLSNAVKFTDEGTVTVELIGNDVEASFRVSDTGHGIRAEDMPRIYEPFWQAESGTTRRAGGTGIGLAVASRLTELLGGHLEARSVVERGSTFTLTIPRVAPAVRTETATTAPG
jgi:PAS domain S-box-containing protein